MSDEAQNDLVDSIKIEDEMKRSYIDYSMSVIIGRALPDVRDGLKPVHRRVLFAMRELGNTHNRAYKKSARVVGDVIGKYHPHGDSAVYDTAVRMAQDFSLRYPLVDGQGNFGSVDGDPPAAMRYTEVRMDRIAEELLEDIDKETVDFGPNYDESLQEPLILPAKFPNLLLNGSAGIAVGMATNIPPHNLNELAAAIKALIDDPELTVDNLMQFVTGPDFPTGGQICGLRAIRDMYTTGRGQMKVRGIAEIQEGKSGKERIIITELPYTVNKANLIENMARLVQSKVLDGITDLRDESNSKGMRVVIELRRGVQPKVILSNLYKHTQLQTTFGANLLAIDDGKPRVMNLKQMLKAFIDHRFEVITRRTEFELRKAEARAHILEGLRIALDNLDEVVKTIRGSKNRDEARAQLIVKFGLSEIQANAILDMRLYQITGLERDKIENEYQDVLARIAYLRDLLDNSEKIYALIREDMDELVAKYGDERRTALVYDEGEVNIEDLIADRKMIITISHRGYIKRVPIDTYKAQRRGGKGVAGMATREEDFVQHLFMASTHDYILFFTVGGRVYWEKVYEIPEAGRTAKGKAIVNMLTLRDDERIAAMIRVREFEDTKHLVMATRKGVIKKTNLHDFRRPRRDGIIAINIDDGDELIGVEMTEGNDGILLATTGGKSIRFLETQLRAQGRATRGVRGIRLREGDSVNSLVIVKETTEDGEPDTFFICTENGYGKRTDFAEYREQGRGGGGIIAIRGSERNGDIVGAYPVAADDALMLVTANGKMIRMNVSDFRVIGRATQGVRIINLDKGDKLVSVAAVEPEDEDLVELDENGDPIEGEAASTEGTEAAEATEASDSEADGDSTDADASADEETTPEA